MPTGIYKKTNNTVPTFGESSQSVRDLQTQLNAKGAGLTVDSKYGPKTQAAVAQFGTNSQDKANELLEINKSPVSSIVGTSSSARNEEAKIKDKFQTLQPTEVDEKGMRANNAAYISDINARIQELNDQGANQLDIINKVFDVTRRETEKKQEGEFGQTSNTLARIGGFLGPSASGSGALISLNREHRDEIVSLEAKRAAALAEAKALMDDKKFEAVKLKNEEIKGLDETIQKRKQDFIDQTVKISQEKRDRDEYSFQVAEDFATSILDSSEGLSSQEILANIQAVSDKANIDPSLLIAAVSNLEASRRETEQEEVLKLAQKYVSANIDVNDTFATASEKVRNSREYSQDIRKAELDIANVQSLINKRKDDDVDFTDPVLTTYSQITGKLVTSPSEARAITGYADSLLAGKEIISDEDAEGIELTDDQLKASDAFSLVQQGFSQLSSKSMEKSTVWEWLATPYAQTLSDEEKAQAIMENGNNPEDFGIYAF